MRLRNICDDHNVLLIFDEIQYDWQLLASLMFIGNATKRLNVLDFGGALGTSYRQNKKFLDLIRIEKKWAIIDQKKFILPN